MTWDNKFFGECAELIKDIVQPSNALGSPYIGLEHISQGQLSLLGFGKSDDVISAKSRFRKGDILFGKLRPYFRKVIIAPFLASFALIHPAPLVSFTIYPSLFKNHYYFM